MSKRLIHGDYVMTYETLEKLTREVREKGISQRSWEESLGMAVIAFFHNYTIQEIKRREKEEA